MKTFVVGENLYGGPIVLDIGPKIILCMWVRGNHPEYVTWEVNDEGDIFSGHYFEKLLDAVADFQKRGWK